MGGCVHKRQKDKEHDIRSLRTVALFAIVSFLLLTVLILVKGLRDGMDVEMLFWAVASAGAMVIAAKGFEGANSRLKAMNREHGTADVRR